MLITLLSAFLKDLVTVARAEAFFEFSEAKREAEIERMLGAGYPRALRGYLATASAEAFVADVQGLLPIITASHGVPGHLLESTKQGSIEEYRFDLPPLQKGEKSSAQKIDPAAVALSEEFLSDIRVLLRDIANHDEESVRRPNGFVQALAAAFSEEVADVFDGAEMWPAKVSLEAQTVLGRLLATGRAIEMGRDIQRFLQEQCSIDSPTLQSPVPLSSSERVDMRASLRARYPGTFPVFDVEPSLGGGLRLFYKGELLDESWMTNVARVFTQLRAQR
jgi:hypothetical protein